jgi:hypothetical protein
MWFWNSPIFPSPSIIRRHQSIQKLPKKKPTYHHPLRFIILLYFLFNISIVFAIHNNFISLSSLYITPTILGSTIIYKNLNKSTSSIFLPKLSIPTISETSSNSSKLSYLCAWQSLHKNSHRLMNFNPGGKPICIDSGATCAISNNKSDFTDLASTLNTVLHGITSGLNIEGKGTLCWSITNDSGDEIDLYIRDATNKQ